MHCYRKMIASLAIVLVLAILAAFCFCSSPTKKDQKTIVTTFYPVYVATLNIAENAKDISVTNLVSSQTGCLHDYQLSPENLITLSTADIWILNGAGAEGFLEEAINRYPSIPMIDSSKGISLLETGEDDPDEFYNSHFWTSPLLYKQQVQNICDALCNWDPENETIYRSNTKLYLEKIDTVFKELKSAIPNDLTPNVVLFHESLTYLARDLHCNILQTLPIGEEGGVAASDLKEAADAIKEAKNVLLLYDNQYHDLEYEYLADSALSSQSLFCDIGVSKSTLGTDKDAWINAMQYNATILKEAFT